MGHVYFPQASGLAGAAACSWQQQDIVRSHWAFAFAAAIKCWAAREQGKRCAQARAGFLAATQKMDSTADVRIAVSSSAN